jgi:hypothetical protein
MPSLLSAPPSQGITAENSNQKRSSFVVSEHGIELGRQGHKKLIQLLERLGHPTFHPGDGPVESFLRGIEFVQDQQRLATFFLEGHRGDGTVITFVITPYEARARHHFDVPTEECHKL